VRRTRSSGTQPIVFANNIVVNLGSGGYDWPTPVLSSSNVFFGAHPQSEPANPGGTRDDPDLLAPGTGGTGIGSIAGYAAHAGSPVTASTIPITSSSRTDFVGNQIAPQHPARGALEPAPARKWHPLIAEVRSERIDGGIEVQWTGIPDGVYRVLREGEHGRTVDALAPGADEGRRRLR
jgi:hypothetical protein